MNLLDEEILPREMQMFKAFLPFLPVNMQKMFAIFLKWQELQYTISYFSRHQLTQKNPDINNLLACLKGILPEEQREQFEQLSDLFETWICIGTCSRDFPPLLSPIRKEITYERTQMVT